MEILLVAATLLGGIAAVWYFFEKFSTKKPFKKFKMESKNKYSKNNPIKILIADDEGRFRINLKNMFEQYDGLFKVYLASDAGEALSIIKDEKLDVIVLDIMMPYGSAFNEYNGNSDPSMIDAGYRLLKSINKSTESNNRDIFIAVVTARSDPTILREINSIIGNSGQIYLKPFNDFTFENDICERFNIESKVPKVFIE